MIRNGSNLQVAYDTGFDGWIVFAPRGGDCLTPLNHKWLFQTREDAQAQRDALDGRLVEVSLHDAVNGGE